MKRDHKVTRMYPRYRKLVFFSNGKAKVLKKSDSVSPTTIDIYVRYPDGFTNEMKNCSVEDLKWATKAFVGEYMDDYER